MDMVWGILWPATNASETAVQKCPGGVESLGKTLSCKIGIMDTFYA